MRKKYYVTALIIHKEFIVLFDDHLFVFTETKSFIFNCGIIMALAILISVNKKKFVCFGQV